MTTARPGYASNAARMAAASVLSMISGASTDISSPRTTARICSASSLRSVTATQTSSACAPPSAWPRPTATMSSYCSARSIRFTARDPCALTRSPMSMGAGSWRSSMSLIALASARHAVAGARCGAGSGADTAHQLGDVLGRRSAAAADGGHAVPAHELLELHAHVDRPQREVRPASDVGGDAGVGDARDRHRAALGEDADGVTHQLGAGRAVEADDVDPERVEDGHDRARLGPQQHACRWCRAGSPRHAAAHVTPVRAIASRAPKMAARTSRMSCAVSMMSRSLPPSMRPWPARRTPRRARRR